MSQYYSVLDKAVYEPLLAGFGVTEEAYLAAMHEVVSLFPRERTLAYYRSTIEQLGSLDQFDLLPSVNQRLRYHPLPILLSGPATVQGFARLLYVGMALHDTRNAYGTTKAFTDLTREDQYRGALFELEVGAELARAGLRPVYRKTSPDFILPSLRMGVEATMRDVPAARFVAERLVFSGLSQFDFGKVEVELTGQGEELNELLVDQVIADVERLLAEGKEEAARGQYRIRIHRAQAATGEKILSVSFGKYSYEDTLVHIVRTSLAFKEEKIRKALAAA